MNDFVMVPRQLLKDVLSVDVPKTKEALDSFRKILDQPAEQHQGEPVASSVFNDPLYNAESDARNASALLEEVLEWFDDGCGRSPEEFKLLRKIGDWLGRSVSRIDRGGDECAHSYANKDGCPECGEAFAGAEPSAPEVKLVSYAEDMSTCTLTKGDGIGYFYDRIDAESGAPVERDERAEFEKWFSEHSKGWPFPSEAIKCIARGNDWIVWQARAALERKP